MPAAVGRFTAEQAVTRRGVHPGTHTVPAAAGPSVGGETRYLLRACRLALAVEKYRSKIGRVPENLQQLAPEYLKTLPLDPGNGLPFRYTPRETGYAILSTVPKSSAPTRLREKDASGVSEGNVAFVVERRW